MSRYESLRRLWPAVLVVVLLVFAVLVAMVQGGFGDRPAAPRSPALTASTPPLFDQIVVVAMENKNLNDVYQNTNAPYENSLNQGVATHWRSVTNPSQPNYIAVLGGGTFGVVGDGNHPHLARPTLEDVFIELTGKRLRE